MRHRSVENVQEKEDANMTQRVILGALAFAVAYAFAQSLPDIIRYIKMTRM